MAQIFPKSANRIPTIILAAAAFAISLLVLFFWYFGSPWWTDVGYRPVQPVQFSHKLHAGDLGMDCRYCHHQVERSQHANIPPTQTCMNCHSLVLPDSEKLLPVRESWASGKPLHWIRVHKLPDFAYFNHSAHLRVGVGCVECHGRVDRMPVVTQQQPLSMGWCLDCHRDPDSRLRPPGKVTDMGWLPGADHSKFIEQFKKDKSIDPPTDCSGCHR